MKIYTKIGDKGTTKLVDGSTVDKFDKRVESYGHVDELNSQLGVVLSLMTSDEKFNTIKQHIEIIQNQLFSVGSLLATADSETMKLLPAINETHIMQLENWIDDYTAPLTPLKNFILPGGHICAAQMHVARTVCRRAERNVAFLNLEQSAYKDVLIYLNRLSDLLFTWARWLNQQHNHTETIWSKKHV